MIDQIGDVYVDTSDLALYGGEKRADEINMILTVDSQGRLTDNGRKLLELIEPRQRLVSGAVNVSEFYDATQGIKLSRKELEGFGVARALSEEHVLAHPFWRVALRHPDAVPAEFAYDKEFMKEAVRRTFAEMEERCGYTQGMGVYLAGAEKPDTMRAWYVSRLGGRSDADGGFHLDGDDGRLVGVAPEAQGASIGFVEGAETLEEKNKRLGSFADVFPSKAETNVKPLENRVQAALDSGRAFEYNGILYIPARDNSGIDIQK